MTIIEHRLCGSKAFALKNFLGYSGFVLSDAHLAVNIGWRNTRVNE